MGYRNLETGFPNKILESRAIIKKDNFAVIPVNGLVKNKIPGFENCDMTILSSPKLGASFVDYVATVLPGGGHNSGFGGSGVETFLFVIDGTITASDGDKEYKLDKHGYIYVPSDKKLYFKNNSNENAEIFLYKRRYKKIDGYSSHTVVNNTDALPEIDYEGMNDVKLKDLLPTDNLGFDMNIHILSFERGASHGYIETHIQEHGALVLEGEGMYNLDNIWMPVEKGDYIFMASYALQAAYGVGRSKRFTYIYSKDYNRDEEI